MRLLRLLLVFPFLAVLALAAGPADAQTLTRGPLIQNPAALTTTMTILWWTDVTGDSTVEYGTTPALGSSVTVPQAPSCEVGAAGTCHTVPLTGLQPGTRYYYRLLTNGTQVLGTHYFQTFKTPTDTSEIFFTVIGDWGQGSSAQGRIGNVMNADDPPLVLTVGDNAYTNGTQSDWDNNVFISQWRNGILRRGVFMPTLGNHDLNSVGASNWQNSVEIRMHALPRNAPAGQEERYFSFDHGNAHFVVLDSNPPAINSTQTNWLSADLAANTRKWTFVFLHHTPYSCANGFASIGSDHTVRNTWGPIFEEHEVDIVFVGHDHIYERSGLVNHYGDGRATRYVMTGGGGATLDGAAQVDGGGPYGQGILHAKEYCPWLATDCPNGVAGQYCSFSRFEHTEVRIQNDSVLTMKAIDDNDVVFDQMVIDKTTICGNGAIEFDEECDQGAANGTSGSCCTADCELKPIGTTCRTASGVCDVAETCTGTSGACPPDGFAPNTTVCRASVGGCDPAELCTGTSATCPPDTLFGSGFVCRPAGGVCDLEEICNGSSGACPPDAKSTATCRNPLDLCDAAESCDGAGNDCPPDAPAPNGTVCRIALGECDVAETCNGASIACPPDGYASSSVVCRNALSVCDVAEHCTGSSPNCPPDLFAPDTVECRPSTGICDAAERCDGASPVCPADGFASAATVCRPAATPCDAAEQCTGTSATCPPDGFAPASTVCRPAVSPCDVAETCTGSSLDCPADAVASASVVCRPASGVCDVVENCDGTTTVCPANGFAPSSTLCRPANGVCDVADYCTGSSAACPPDAFATSAVECRPAADVCDAAETCSGTSASCPADGYLSPAVECRPAAGPCDLPEQCTGASAACPADTGQPDGDADGVCDAADICPLDADPGQEDGDGDGLGDACDPCTNAGAVQAVKAKLTLQKLALPLGDDRLKFSGTMTVPSDAIDPAVDGLRVLIVDAGGQTIVDATVPPGEWSTAIQSGWKVNGSRTTFVYKNKGGTIASLAGVNKVILKRSTKVPGQVRFAITAIGGAYPLPASLPVKGTVILDPPFAATNQCGDAVFPGPRPYCAFVPPAGTVKCK